MTNEDTLKLQYEMRDACLKMIANYEDMIRRAIEIISENPHEETVADIAKIAGGRIGELRIKIATIEAYIKKAKGS